jgi:hypothetical protein
MYGQTPILDLSNPQAPVYTVPQVRSLAPACYRIEVKNLITVTDASIVVCTGTDPLTTCSEPGSCPTTVDPNATGYYNLVATVTASIAQPGVVIEFDYLKNDTPVTSPTVDYRVTVNLTAGDNTVYLFTANQLLAADDTITLYGARVYSE